MPAVVINNNSKNTPSLKVKRYVCMLVRAVLLANPRASMAVDKFSACRKLVMNRGMTSGTIC